MSKDPSPFIKRIIVPSHTVQRADVKTATDVESLIEDATNTIELEIIRFKSKVHKGQGLDRQEASMLTSYTRALTELSKEQRERKKAEQTELGNLSDDELIEAVKVLLEKKGYTVSITKAES